VYYGKVLSVFALAQIAPSCAGISEGWGMPQSKSSMPANG
jgi:hypothetical protein